MIHRVSLAALLATQAWALPNMIRLGYPNCLSCHVAPQGGGLLNRYGKGIDQAQSLKGGEYQPSQLGLARMLSWNGRIDQDVRLVMSSQVSSVTNGPTVGLSRSRFFYRNVTNLGKGFRFSGMLDGETNPIVRRSFAYEPGLRPGQAMVTQALVSYRPKDGFEVSAGRDMLPQGLIIPDQTTYIKARNRLGYYDTPLQAKALFWRKRWFVSPFAFAPNGREYGTAREKGGGLMAEVDVLGKGKTIVGVNTLGGVDRNGHRVMSGVYTRLGFGRWGIFAEHDYTRREFAANDVRFGQQASYFQGFHYFKEWLVASAVVERLTVQRPYAERLWAYKADLSARLSSNATVGLRGGVQRNALNGQLSPVVSVTLAMKTVR